MGKTVIGDLAVRVGADTSGLTKGLSRSKKQIRQLSREAKEGGKVLARYAAGAAAAGTAIAAGLTVKGLAAVDAQAKLSLSLKTTVASMATMERAGQLSGISLEKINASATRLTRRLSLAEAGTGPAAEAIKRLGINAQEVAEMPLDRRIAYVNQQIREMIPVAEQAGMATQFFGEEAGIAMQRLTPEVIAQARREAEMFGTAISDVDAAKVEAANDAMSTMSTAVDGVSKRLAVEMAPMLQGIGRLFVEAANDAGGIGEAVSETVDYGVKGFGFIVDAVAGFHRTVILAGKGVAGLGLGIVDVMLTAANAIVNKPVQALNELLAKINEFAGTDFQPVSLTGLGQSIQKELEIVRGAQDEFMADFQETLMQPLPSTQFEQFVAQAREYSEEAAKEAARIRKSFMGQSDGSPGSAETGNLSDRMDALRQANMTEIELMREKHELELEEIARAKEAEIEVRGTYDQLLQETAARHQKELTELERRESQRRKQLADEERKFKVDALDDALGNMTTLMNTGSRKMFEIGKFAANSNALLNTYEAVTGAYKVGAQIGGPVLGAAYGTAAFGAQMAQVQKINSTQFGSSGGASGSATQAINDSGTPVQSAGSEQSVSITLDVRGSERDRAVAGSLVEQINEEAERGMRISRVALA